MLAQLNNEILIYGPVGLLPQNLNAKWLGILEAEAETFLNSNFSLEECLAPSRNAGPLLTACVSEILRAQSRSEKDMSDEDLFQTYTLYALCLMIESVNRQAELTIDPPTLDTVLSWERIIALESTHPEFIELLEQACMVKDKQKNWFQVIRDKFISGG